MYDENRDKCIALTYDCWCHLGLFWTITYHTNHRYTPSCMLVSGALSGNAACRILQCYDTNKSIGNQSEGTSSIQYIAGYSLQHPGV